MKAPECHISRQERMDDKAAKLARRELGQGLIHAAEKFFGEEENRNEFDKWFLKEYGQPYTWKTRTA